MHRINKGIGIDLSKKLTDKKISQYYIHTVLGLCSQPTLTKILKGNNGNNIPLSKIIDIYKAIGEKEINIENNGVVFIVRF